MQSRRKPWYLFLAPLVVLLLVGLSTNGKQLWISVYHRDMVVYLDGCRDRVALERAAFERLAQELKDHPEKLVVRVRIKGSHFPDKDYLAYWRNWYNSNQTTLRFDPTCCGHSKYTLATANVQEAWIGDVAHRKNPFDEVEGRASEDWKRKHRARKR
jgi:hypothetical protein